MPQIGLRRFLTSRVLGYALVGFAIACAGAKSVEPQPHMKGAMNALQTAKDHLQQASADKGGHRVAAISLVNRAIAEVQAGIDFDNSH